MITILNIFLGSNGFYDLSFILGNIPEIIRTIYWLGLTNFINTFQTFKFNRRERDKSKSVWN